MKIKFRTVVGSVTNTPAKIMPFGKHAGLPMRFIPTSYLYWCFNTLEAGDVFRGVCVELFEVRRLRPFLEEEDESYYYDQWDHTQG